MTIKGKLHFASENTGAPGGLNECRNIRIIAFIFSKKGLLVLPGSQRERKLTHADALVTGLKHEKVLRYALSRRLVTHRTGCTAQRAETSASLRDLLVYPALDRAEDLIGSSCVYATKGIVDTIVADTGRRTDEGEARWSQAVLCDSTIEEQNL